MTFSEALKLELTLSRVELDRQQRIFEILARVPR